MLAAAAKFKMSSLFDRCDQHLCNTITVQNAVEFFIAGFLNSKMSLKEVSENFIEDNYNAVVSTDGMNILENNQEAQRALLKFAFKRNDFV